MCFAAELRLATLTAMVHRIVKKMSQKCILGDNMLFKKIYFKIKHVIFAALIVMLGMMFVIQSDVYAQGSMYVKANNVDVDYTELGDTIEMPIIFYNTSYPWELGGFELNIKYNPDNLTPVNVLPGSVLEACDWEYFDFGSSVDGILTIAGLADLSGNSSYPSCYLSGVSGEFLKLRFFIADDSSIYCTDLPVDFYWSDCTHNLFSNITGDTLFGSYGVYNSVGQVINADNPLPSFTGAPDACLDELNGENVTAFKAVNYGNAEFRISCIGQMDGRGDINLNNITYEVGDYVLFSNYFLYGLRVFTKDPDQQSANSDVNANGENLETGDIMYLLRVICGQAAPYPKYAPVAADSAIYTQDTSSHSVDLTYTGTVAAAHLIFLGNIDITEPEINGIPIIYVQQDDTTRVLIAELSDQTEEDVFGEGHLFSYTGTGELVYVSCSDYWGNEEPAQIIHLDSDTVYFIQDFVQKSIEMQYPDTLHSANFRFLGTIDIVESDVYGIPINYGHYHDTTGVLVRGSGIPPSEHLLYEGLLFHYTGNGVLFEAGVSDSIGLNIIPVRIIRQNINYICGDANNDNLVNISDAVYMIGYVFNGGSQPHNYSSGDVNCDGKANVSDAVYIIMYVFSGGTPPCDTNGDGSPDC